MNRPLLSRAASVFSPVIGAFVLAGAIAVPLPAPAAATDKTYQVTGPVLEVTDTTITVQKGKEKWQLARDKDTKVTGDLKVGSKVTIEYTMTAKKIDAKAGDAKAGDAKAGDAKAGDAKK